MKIRFEPVKGRNVEIIEAVMQAPEIVSLPESILFNIRLCVEEVEENILNYSGSEWVEVSAVVSSGAVIITFRDGGIPFNPLARKDPDITASVQDRQIGGLGIFLCKRMMDGITYRYDGGCNVLTLTKNI